MPSSLIFAGLVVLWLLILVPAVARRQQEVARPTVAALSGRVLERPQRRRRTEEVDDVHEADDDAPVATRQGEDLPDTDDELDMTPHDRRWERPAPRYRPGRGGFDPEAAALTARARYAFRQRVVLTMLVAAVVTAVVAAVSLPALWWVHGAIDVSLVGYLVYLRRQVRLEEAIRERRAARMAGTRRPAAAEDPELDEWAHRGREASRRSDEDGELTASGEPAVDEADESDDPSGAAEHDDDLDLASADDDAPDVERVPGTGTPLRAASGIDGEPALPRLTPAPPPALPAGTTLVDGDLDDPEMQDLDAPARPDYRRAAGQ